MPAIEQIVDLRRYPIADPGSAAARAVVATCREQLRHNDLCLLAGFLRPDALAAMREQARVLTVAAHRTEHWRATPNGAAGSDSRLARETRASIGAVAYDRIAADSPLRALYLWPALSAFLAAVYQGEPLFPTADPLVACMLTVLRDGDELGWHYDPNDGVVSLALQDCGAGGAFEFAPRVRGLTQANEVDELAVLEGTYAGLIRVRPAPGTLSLFNGHRSLHRVAPVEAGPARIMALFNYAASPGYRFDARIQQNFFGRTA